MITRLARRLGFQTSVPVAALDDWVMPQDGTATALAPRGASATCLVDGRGRVQPTDRSYTLEWTLAAGARWVSALESDRVKQQVIAPAVVETTVQTPSGPIVQRIAAAVVDGQPATIMEIENTGGVAIAVGLVARPLVHGGRGFLGHASASATELSLGDQGSVRFGTTPVATAVADGTDLLTSLPEPDAGISDAQVNSRSGAAQACAVFPLPHTATLRVVIELGEPVRPTAAVPAIADVQRGWAKHLEAGSRYSVGDTAIDERIGVAHRGLLTSWPTREGTPAMITALAEAGFGADAPRLFTDLDRVDDDPAVLAAVARWAQLGDPIPQLDALDRMIGPVARAAHTVASGAVQGPAWLPVAWSALADRLDLIDQPDVAERVRSLTLTAAAAPDVIDIDDLLKRRAKLAKIAEPQTAARLTLGVRSRLLAESVGGVDLLPALPVGWRGQTIDALGVPIAGGTISFGVRWHGPRPALLWEIDRSEADGVTAAPCVVTASSIDPTFRSDEASGETLLADPGWPTS